MAGPINLNVIDTPPIDDEDLHPTFERWITNLVDTINESFMALDNAFDLVLAISSAQIGGMGAGPIAITVYGLTSSGAVYVNLLSSSNNVTVQSVVSETNQFTVTFSADPGASAIIQYSAFISTPQGN